jgi:TolB protein
MEYYRAHEVRSSSTTPLEIHATAITEPDPPYVDCRTAASKMKRYRLWITVLVLTVVLLASCSPTTVLPESRAMPSQPPAQGKPDSDVQKAPPTTNATVAGRLLYVQDGNIYLHQGSQIQQLTSDGVTFEPAWAPDGRHIATVRYAESYSDVYVLDIQNGRTTQVTFNGSDSPPRSEAFVHQIVWAVAPTWTPDGANLVFLSQERPATSAHDNPPLYEYPLSLYSYPVALIGKRPPSRNDLLIRAKEADLQWSTWAPDHSLLTYVQVPRNNKPRQIMQFDPQTGVSIPYTGIPDDAYDPAWSPDSRWLAFTTVVDGQTDIWAIPHPAIGGPAVRLTTTGQARAPEWSPDGRQLAFIQVGDKGTDVYVMSLQDTGSSLSGAEIRPLTTTGRVDVNSGLSWAKDQ